MAQNKTEDNGVIILEKEGFNKYHKLIQEFLLKFIFKEKRERHKEIEEKVAWTVVEED